MLFYTPDFDFLQLMKYSTLLFITLSLTAATASAQQPKDQAEEWFDRAMGLSDDSGSERSRVPELYDPEGYVYHNTVNPDAPYHRSNGIIITGEPGHVRAMEAYSWSDEGVKRYADVANLYAETFGSEGVKIYCMPIPLASAFYSPDAIAPKPGRSQYAAIRRMFSYLNPAVTGVNVVPALGEHADEPIYSRTDHHWAPLGAYYAARQLAAAAGLPFLDLKYYKRHEVPGYVGTMYNYSKDPSVKASPETFVYYTPTGLDYTTTYITYRTKGLTIIGESDPEQGKFFLPFKGVSTYCTFMGGDSKITKVHTGRDNGRRLIIFKDSFGNAIPGYLFDTFEEIHVIDCRYFNRNIKSYVRDNAITDMVFANNLGHSGSTRTCNAYRKFLTQ